MDKTVKFKDSKLEEVSGGNVELIGGPIKNADGSMTLRCKFDGQGWHRGPHGPGRPHGQCGPQGQKGECQGGCKGNHKSPFAALLDVIRENDTEGKNGEFKITLDLI